MDIESKLITEQQSEAYDIYERECYEFDRTVSDESFIYFYANYCYENQLFNDINQSNL